MARIPCIIGLKGRAAARARYALEMLLLPLGHRPLWEDRAGETRTGLYYGPGSVGIPDTWLTAAYSQEAIQNFEERRLPPVVRFAWKGEMLPMIFPVRPPSEPDPHLPPFDLVAGAFFWLSGFQEMTISARDRHGRFPYSESLQAVSHSAHVPIVDVSRGMLAQALEARGVPPRLPRWHGRAWALCPTHDVDYLRKYRPGIWYREMVEYFLLGRRPGGGGARSRRLMDSISQALGTDPFRQSIREMIRSVADRAGSATWFFKAGSHEPYDVPYGLSGSFIRDVFREIGERDFEVGIHPSYFASVNAGRTHSEKQRLEHAVGRGVHSVRMHYLRYNPRVEPLLLEEVGFQVDSTLGFAEQEGFRRGTCLPFRVYDLVDDRPTSVWEIPLHVMDSTLFGYRGLDLDGANEATNAVMKACLTWGGLCVCLWHSVLRDNLDFPGWQNHFEETLDAATREEGAILSLSSAMDQWQRFLGES